MGRVKRVFDKVDRGFLDRSDLNLHHWGSVKSQHSGAGPYSGKHKKAKQFAKAGVGVTSSGISAAKFATGSPGAVSVAFGAAVSSTGVGLIAAGGVMTLGSAALSALSVHKTSKHINGLYAILGKVAKGGHKCARCDASPGDKDAHAILISKVLTYIIEQKQTKKTRKVTGAVPIIGGAANFVIQAKHSISKRRSGQRGVKRHFNAELLAIHLITHECELADAIVAELLGADDLDAIKAMNSDEAAPLIFEKMASL